MDSSAGKSASIIEVEFDLGVEDILRRALLNASSKWSRPVFLPSASRGVQITARSLQPYGKLHVSGVKPTKLSPTGTGVLLHFDADTSYAGVLKALEKPKATQYDRCAAVVAHNKGLALLPLPEVTAEKRKPLKGELDPIIIHVRALESHGLRVPEFRIRRLKMHNKYGFSVSRSRH